eukprot:1436362-Pleurochrysis_carterae.AAC.2
MNYTVDNNYNVNLLDGHRFYAIEKLRTTALACTKRTKRKHTDILSVEQRSARQTSSHVSPTYAKV